MVTKKKPELNPEKNRLVYFQLGLLVTGAGLLMAFTWRSPILHDQIELVQERTSEIPVMEVAKELDEPIIQVVEPQKQVSAPSNPLISENLTTVNNVDKSAQIGVTTDPITDIKIGVNDIPIGPAPALDVIVDFPQHEAEFVGNWSAFLRENLIYPEESRFFQEEGVVWVEFVVDRDGSLTNIRVNERSHKSRDLRNEALRVVKQSPKWKPAITDGEYVKTNARVKINFKLQ